MAACQMKYVMSYGWKDVDIDKLSGAKYMYGILYYS